jgi:quercetin dioxygenase-like cupin family protein
MKQRVSCLATFLVAVLACGVVLGERTAAQYARRAIEPLPDGWENNRFRLSRISVEPGAALAGSDADRILVYLTAAPDGRIAPAEAIWQPAGAENLENTGRTRVEAIAIELKEVNAEPVRGTPPEALPVARRADVRWVIDNPRVLVTRNRYEPTTAIRPWHFHPEDILVVYLRGGHAWPILSGWGSHRVRRGDVDIIPANTFHTFGNAGGDPLEFLMVVPR